MNDPDSLLESLLVDPHQLGMSLTRTVDRRGALQIGLFGTAGLLGGNAFAAGAASATASTPKPPATPAVPAKPKPNAKATSVIQIFLWGGMSTPTRGIPSRRRDTTTTGR
jgi:hypothetical protein